MHRLAFRLLPLVGIVCLALLAMSMITRIDVHSDILFLDALMDDLFVTHGAWSAWRFSPAPSYFPDMLAYVVGYFVFDTAPWRIWFVAVVQIAAVAALSDQLAMRVRPELTAFGRGLLLAAACGLVAVANHTTTMIGILFNANNIQVPTLISSLLLLMLTIDGIAGRRPRTTFAATVLFGAVAYASSAVFLLSFTIPCLLTLLALIVSRVDFGARRRALLLTVGAIVASQGLGWLLAQALTWNAPLAGRLTLDASRALLAWHRFESATANILAIDNLWSVGLFTVCLAAWLAACGTALRLLPASRSAKVGWTDRFIVLFVLCSSISSVGGAIASGGFGDLYGYRYFMTFAAVSVLWAATRIDLRIAHHRHAAGWAAVGVVAMTVVSLGQTVAAPRRDLAEIARHGAIARPEEEVARCLAALMGRGIRLDAGIADYWYARGVRYHLHGAPNIQPVAADLSPFFWISSLGPVEHPRHYGIERYDFAILRRRLPDVMTGYDLVQMRAQMPKGFETFACDAADADVLVYRGDALDEKVRMRFDNFVFREKGSGRLTLSAAELPGQIGMAESDAKVVDGGQAGYLIFGPYIHLEAGHYRLQLRYTASGMAASPTIATVDVGRFDVAPATPFAQADVPSASSGVLRADFVVPEGGAIHVETRVHYAGSGRLQVDSVGIVRRN